MNEEVEYEDDLSNDILDAMDETGYDDTPEPVAEEAPEDEEGEEGDAAPEDVEAAQESEDSEGVKTDGEANAGDSTPIPAPASMSTADAENFSKLPRELQSWIASREKDRNLAFQRKTYELANAARKYQGIDEAFSQIDDALRLNGKTRETYINELITADKLLHSHPQQAIQWLAQSKGIDLRQLTQQPEGDQGQPGQQFQQPMDPRFDQVFNQLQQVQSYIQNQQQSVTDQQKSAAMGQIQQFRMATDEAGNKLYPYFDEVRTQMAPIVTALEKKGVSGSEAMKQAYDAAIQLVPNVKAAHDQLIAQRYEAEARARAEEARKKTKSKKTDSVSRQSEPMPDDIFAALNNTWDELAA